MLSTNLVGNPASAAPDQVSHGASRPSITDVAPCDFAIRCGSSVRHHRSGIIAPPAKVRTERVAVLDGHRRYRLVWRNGSRFAGDCALHLEHRLFLPAPYL